MARLSVHALMITLADVCLDCVHDCCHMLLAPCSMLHLPQAISLVPAKTLTLNAVKPLSHTSVKFKRPTLSGDLEFRVGQGRAGQSTMSDVITLPLAIGLSLYASCSQKSGSGDFTESTIWARVFHSHDVKCSVSISIIMGVTRHKT